MAKLIILVGSPGCGKATIGQRLAKAKGYTFLEKDMFLKDSGSNLEALAKLDDAVWTNLDEGKTVVLARTPDDTGTGLIAQIAEIEEYDLEVVDVHEDWYSIDGSSPEDIWNLY